MSDKNPLLPSAGSSSGSSQRAAHQEATADVAIRGRSRSPITDVPPRGRRSRSPSLDPRSPTLRRDWYAARKDKWYAEDMEWWRGELRRAEERQARQRQQRQQQQQQQQLTTAASELGSSAVGSGPSSFSASSGSTSALDPPTGVETATRTLAPRRTLYDEAWSRSTDANAAMIASYWSAEFAAAAHHDPQRQREQEQKQGVAGGGEEQKKTAGDEEQEQLDEKGSKARVSEEGAEGKKEGEDVEQGQEEESERRKGKKRDAKL